MNDIVIKAASVASTLVPETNSQWHDEYIREFKNVDMSVAVATDSGLITPIVKYANLKRLEEIAAEVKDLAARARENKLAPEEFQGGTFTISNLGMFGVNQFNAIINPPQACILAVGSTFPKILPGEDTDFRKAQVMNVTLSSDHRVVDGAVAAQWAQHFRRFVENPELML